ncbi:unnamed protein product [Ceutorhynchus assimilis]|uniref:GYF domain-containing protein n=1 Tax=Ceutorhynchus assimilis TaxID=467358 RepID=A0A9N9QFV4_9CUCU|nr:unnamed protein product [Ceutorhynchus assimilis]
MSKRKYESQFSQPQNKRVSVNATDGKKHTLDSDEEDFVDEDNVLDENDIEGEEDGFARQDGEQKMTAFNMREELEEGHFDRDGHFIWDNEKEVRDNWLDNIDWQRIQPGSSKKYAVESSTTTGADSSSSDSETEADFSEFDTYKQIIAYLKPKESINKALKRLGGADIKLSSVERLRRKKAGTLKVSEDVTKLTELANQILTRLGNMDVYQETFEQIQSKLDSKKSNTIKEPELDMYSDDFDIKEKSKLTEDPSTSSDQVFKAPLPAELKWEFKWSNDDEKIQGPFNNAQMVKWQHEDYFKGAVMVRKCGEKSNFYSLNRIDFELYE